MAEGSMERRLAAILAIDVAGYSRLMGADEDGTLAALKAHRAVTKPIGEGHGGRVVGTAGDGELWEILSVTEAVLCAVEVQDVMAARNSEVPEERQMLYRIRINLGDVMIDGADIHGDGVNIAARLEALAAPGGICISQTVMETVRDHLEVAFEDMGEVEVKNIARPVRAWRWSPEQTVAAAPQAAPDKPSLAVLPFDNMSGDAEHEYFSDSIAEDIITALSRFHQFFVIARNSSFTYKGRAVDIKQVADELGVQYVIEGSVRRAGNRVRITAQLIDAATGNHIWAERYDRELDDIFAVQDDITERIVMAVAPELGSTEMARARRKNLPKLGVWELIARVSSHYSKFADQDTGAAEDLLLKALERDPKGAKAHALLSTIYGLDALYGWRRPAPDSRTLALQMGQKAVELDREDEASHISLGISLYMLKWHEEAIERLRTAIKINPNHSNAVGHLGIVLVYSHQPEEGLAYLQKAIQLSPKDTMLPFYIVNIGMHHFIEERYDEARMWSDKSLHEHPNFPSGLRLLASALGMLGNLNEARAAYENLDRMAPGITIAACVQAVPVAFENDAERYAEGLRRAGMPEG